MGKRKYSLCYLASWMNVAWFGGESSDKHLYDSLQKGLLSMDGLKHVWIVSGGEAQDIAVRYGLAQELLQVVARQNKVKIPLYNELPWIGNKAVYHELVGETLPDRFEGFGPSEHAIFVFNGRLPENQKYLNVEEKQKMVGAKKKTKKVGAKSYKAAESRFDIHEYCRPIRPMSEFSEDKYHGCLVFFTKRDNDEKWHMVVAHHNRDNLWSTLGDSREPDLIKWALGRPKAALLVRDPFMDLSMLLSMAGVKGDRGLFERILLKVPLFQASEALCAMNLTSPPFATPQGPKPASQAIDPLSPLLAIDPVSSLTGIDPLADSEPSPASESDLDFSFLSLSRSLASLDDDYIPL